MNKKICKILMIFVVVVMGIFITGCSNKESSSTIDESKSAQVNKNDDSDQIIDNKYTCDVYELTSLSEKIKNKLVTFAPGLFDYSPKKEPSDENIYYFIVYGYLSENNNYSIINKSIEGINYTWKVIPKVDVEKRFEGLFGKKIGDYKPILDELNPTLYREGDNYYVRVDTDIEKRTFECKSEEKTKMGYKVTLKGISNDGMEIEYCIAIVGANNENGFIIESVGIIPN